MEILEELYGRVPNDQLAARLGRSVWGMRLKAVKMGVLPWKYQLLSKGDIALITGQTGHKGIAVWIERGWLIVDRVPGRGAGGFRYIVTEQDLVDFLREHDEQVNRRLVDVAYQRHVRQWITTGEAYRRGGPAPGGSLNKACDELGLEVRWRGVRRVLLEADLPRLIEWRRAHGITDQEHRRRYIRRARVWHNTRRGLTLRRAS